MRSCRSPRERPEAGSSSMSVLGSAASAMASATCRCSPWESEPTSLSELVSIATLPAASRARSRARGRCRGASTGRRRPPRRRRSRGRCVLDGEPVEEPRLLIRAGEPELRTVPGRASGHVLAEELDACRSTAGRSPQMTLKSVVLPAPFGPRIARRSPWATSRSTSLTARRPPKRRPTPRRRRVGSAFSADGSVLRRRPTSMTWFVMTPFLTTLIFPATEASLHAGG